MKSMKNIKTTSKIFFCCLNSKRTKYIEIILLIINFVCLVFYILFFSTISWSFIHIVHQLLYYLDFIFLLINIAINIYFIHIRKKKLINSYKNDIAKTLSISIILICSVSLILNYFASFNILYSINNYNKNLNSIYITIKKNFYSIFFIIIINVSWLFILLLWIADFIRIKVKSDETFYNYLKKKTFKKSQYLFNEECLKESNNQNKNYQNGDIKVKDNDKNNNDELNSISMQLIKSIKNYKNNTNNISIDNNSIELNFSNNLNDIDISQASHSLNDSYQKPVNMVIIGTDERGYPIYGHQNSFDKSQASNDSDSFSYQDNKNTKLDQNNYIKYNNNQMIHGDNENKILEKNLNLERDKDEMKMIEKKNDNEIKKENDNDNN